MVVTAENTGWSPDRRKTPVSKTQDPKQAATFGQDVRWTEVKKPDGKMLFLSPTMSDAARKVSLKKSHDRILP